MSEFQNPSGSLRATGTILPSRFVKLSGENSCAACSTGEFAYGIAQAGTRRFDSSNAAESGDSVGVYTNGQICWLEAASAITAGDRVKSDSVGRGVAATGAGTDYGCIALETATTTGDFIRVRVQISDWVVAGSWG